MTTATVATTAQETAQTIQLNQISVTGRLGADCEVRHFDNSSKTSISIAVNEAGQEKPSWYKVVLWNLSEKQNYALTRGSKVTVTGEMRFETWDDKETGESRRKLKLHVNDKMALELHGRSNKAAKPVAAPAPVAVAQKPIADDEWDSIPF